ncbi:MAG: hypothetical protein KF889_23355 [Alphaproteobacteria bacterium]|nr:hypothetical protein [Alphaproteobacteria bacterium]MCW5742896.1 hypothetical protein [Alphaproteobacteria bacterium]
MAPRKSRSTTSVTLANLERLGAARLAALLMDQGRRDRAFRERLALAIAAEAGAEELAEQIERRLIGLSHLSRRSRLGEARAREVGDEIGALREIIVGDVAPALPGRAIDLLRRFIAMGPTVLGLVGTTEGLAAVFDRAEDDLSGLWAKHPARDINEVVEWVIGRIEQEQERAMNINPYERALGEDGLRLLADRIGAAFGALPREAVGQRWAHTIGRHYDARVRAMVLRQILRQIADALGDVDALIAVESEFHPTEIDAPAIARRLLAAGRAGDALSWLDNPRFERATRNATALRLETLEALGRRDDAQALRLLTFERTLEVPLLRDYLKRLPDFTDADAEKRIVAQVAQHRSAGEALAFLVTWPALDAAAALVDSRLAELKPVPPDALLDAATRLRESHPAQAVALIRAAAPTILDSGFAHHYAALARAMVEVRDLPPATDGETHDGWVDELRLRYPRRDAFWSRFRELDRTTSA